MSEEIEAKSANEQKDVLDVLNGDKIEDLVNFFRLAYEPMHSDDGKGMHNPIVARQERIKSNTSGLEDKVKNVLGNSNKASKEQAQNIVKNLAYAIAKGEGYNKEIGDFKDEDVRRYLSQASNATGDPTIGNKWALVKSIMNMISAKPGSVQYDANSTLGHFISYAATEQDEESRKIAHYRTIVAEHWTEPETGIKLQNAFKTPFGIPLDPTATANDFFAELEARYAVKSQAHTLETTPKTYLQQGKGDYEAKKGSGKVIPFKPKEKPSEAQYEMKRAVNE